ncbi:MAG TPA: hypothetical protein VLF40_00025 [Candidatus Saccharimonadales bacterium]|nr:hypothetical protein [Candidatus Saccharimonadales bacterium]
MTDDKYAFVDKWRPSRVRVVTKGELFWTEVDILNISDLQTAQAMRSGLERFCIKVNYFEVGLSEHIKKVLGSSTYAKAPYLIIAAHGAETDGDISLGDRLEGELAATQDFHGTMTPGDLEKCINVEGKVIINTACGSGASRLSDVFMQKGRAKAYIADADAPFGYTSYLFPVLLFYFLTQYPNLSLKEAFDRTKAADSEEFKTWQLFE